MLGSIVNLQEKKIMKLFQVTMAILIVLLMISKTYSCTFFYAATGQKALFGSNEDWISAESYIWFYPAKKNEYGRIFFGFEVFPGQKEPFSGINDQGLCFDLALTSNKEYSGKMTGETFKGNIFDKILKECSSVDQVLELLEKYNNLQVEYTYLAIMFGDSYGNSLIVDCGQVGEKTTKFQIVPNDSKAVEPCKQYQIAYRMLNNSDEIKISLFKKILANTHVELNSAVTAYSTIFDLKNSKIYIYYFHNFMEEVVLDINEELKKGFRTIELCSLFPPSIAVQDFNELKNREIKEKKSKRSAKNISTENFEQFSGKFVNSIDQKDSIIIDYKYEKLYMVNTDQLKVELYPESLTKFFLPLNGDFSFTFYKDLTGKFTKVVIENELLGIKIPYQKIK